MMRKDDITYHVLGYGYDRAPAVNVKVRFPYGSDLDALVTRVANDLGLRDVDLVLEWWHAVEDRDPNGDHFYFACEQGYDTLQDRAREIWRDDSLRVYAEGRSGGWAYVDSIRADDVESWDAIALGRWAQFARIARVLADGVPYQVVWSILANDYEREREELLTRILA